MYEQFHGLTHRPFSAVFSLESSVLLPEYEAGLSSLKHHLVSGDGIGLLTGIAGIGKSFLCRHLTEILEPDARVAYLKTAAYPTRSSLLQAILYHLGKRYDRQHEQELRLQLLEDAEDIVSRQGTILLIVDESHLLSRKLLEELRSLTNFDLNGSPLFRLLIAGQPKLEETLTHPELEAFNQRLSVQISLPRLKRDESLRYLQERIAAAGGDLDQLVTPEAQVYLIHTCDGVPRMLNQLVDHALSIACMHQQSEVCLEIAEQAYEDLKSLPLHWNPPQRKLDPAEQWKSEKDEFYTPPVSESLISPENNMQGLDDPEATVIEFDFNSPEVPDSPVEAVAEPENVIDASIEAESCVEMSFEAEATEDQQNISASQEAVAEEIATEAVEFEATEDIPSEHETIEEMTEPQSTEVLAIEDLYAKLDAQYASLSSHTENSPTEELAVSEESITEDEPQQEAPVSPDFISSESLPIEEPAPSTSPEEDLANTLFETLEETRHLREQLSVNSEIPVDELSELLGEDQKFDLVLPEDVPTENTVEPAVEDQLQSNEASDEEQPAESPEPAETPENSEAQHEPMLYSKLREQAE